MRLARPGPSLAGPRQLLPRLPFDRDQVDERRVGVGGVARGLAGVLARAAVCRRGVPSICSGMFWTRRRPGEMPGRPWHPRPAAADFACMRRICASYDPCGARRTAAAAWGARSQQALRDAHAPPHTAWRTRRAPLPPGRCRRRGAETASAPRASVSCSTAQSW